MTTIRGQALPIPKTFLEFPDKRDDNKDDKKETKKSPLPPSTSHDAKEKDSKSKKDKSKAKDKEFDLGRMVTTSVAFMGPASPSSPRSPVPPSPKGRDRSSSLSGSLTSRGSISGRSSRSSISGGATPQAHPSGLLPSVLPRSSMDNGSVSRSQSSTSKRSSFFSRLRHSTTSDAPSSPSSSHNPKHQYTITMVPQHDIHITWLHPVPSGSAFVAGTFPVPGHQLWDKIPMTRIPGTDHYEVHLDIQEVEDISDYVDEEGYTHHALEHHDEDPSSPASTQRIRKRDKLRQIIFGRSRSASTSERPKDLHLDLPYHHQSKDGVITPLTHEYKYQYKFVIDDIWQCDPNRPQAHDGKGNTNNELAVTLIEQIHQTPSPNRSRSSSVYSQNSAQVQSTPSEQHEETTTSHDIAPQELVEETPASTTAAAVDSLAPPAADSTPISSVPGTPSTPSRQPRDTYEAVMIFDETDDMSDGEGGRRSKRSSRYVVIKDSDDEDDAADNNKSNNQEAIGKRASEETIAPQQDQKTPRGEQGKGIEPKRTFHLHANTDVHTDI